MAAMSTASPVSRLRSEFARLFLPDPARQPGQAPAADDLVDAQGRTRAIVLELGAPPEWAALRTVWQGVQSDLGLPAPAIAVSGAGIQLWFSAPAPIAVTSASRFLEALRARYLPSVGPQRLRLFPALDASTPEGPVCHAPVVPARQPDGTTWSAFVAPDLVAVFEDTPWLDSAPGEDGQAALLERLHVMGPGWLEILEGAAAAGAGTAVAVARPIDGGMATAQDGRQSARDFLLRVMNDETATLSVRVDAARALLHAPRSDA
jgi:hypothetical protein